ncbi:hypothetical protein DI09_10p130 [Mitosporidium daphniae]|uniref:Uncharacterized protein n=1 Tax=Mitosporidium daphniae TaxID=1485682 RepID=A0A098VZD5_9MICR|nr:uncharacterized protein DI09_10p130 [Mitosporidium daphniae]KGG53116.1 hypothetical protein DI09_10p130 [Mitosporidium daphniae]|eukprot:XP_013239543.1 uncharacterized protein DI09_10p130 [Mitosporidium daphniae]
MQFGNAILMCYFLHSHHLAAGKFEEAGLTTLVRNGVLAKDAVKKDGGGKANWGKLGEEFLDEEFTNPHRDPEPEPSVKFVNRDKQV